MALMILKTMANAAKKLNQLQSVLMKIYNMQKDFNQLKKNAASIASKAMKEPKKKSISTC